MRTIIATALFLLLIGAEARGQEEIEDLIWLKQTDQGDGFYQVKFSDSGHLIAGHGRNHVLFYDTETGDEIIRIPGNNEVFFINNDENFVRLNEDTVNIEIFDTFTFEPIDTLDLRGRDFNRIELSDDGSLLACLLDSGLAFYNFHTEELLGEIEFPEETYKIWGDNELKMRYRQINGMWFSCDNRFLFVGFKKVFYPLNPWEDHVILTEVIEYDLTSFEEARKFSGFSTARISNDCKSLVMRILEEKKYTDGLKIFDYVSGDLVHPLHINGWSITGYEFSPDDNYLVTTQGSGANPGSVMLIWDMQTGEEVHRYTIAGYSNLDISPNGLYIVVSVGRQLALFNTRFNTNPIEDGVESKSILYPNPTDNTLNINLKSSVQDIERIKILNNNGSLITEFSIEESLYQDGSLILDTSGLASGAYIAIIQTKTKNYSYKFIKK